MSGSPFIPRVFQEEQTRTTTPVVTSQKSDPIGKTILSICRYVLTALLFLLPVFFIPGLPASLAFDKSLLSVVFGLAVVMLLALSSLRYEKIRTVVPWSIGAFLLFVAASFVSGFLSGDILDSLRGNVLESQTASFVALLGLLMIVPLVFQSSKKMSLYAIAAFCGGAALVLLYTFIRLLFSWSWLSLGSFQVVTVSPIGSFNDLAILSAVVILISLITLLLIPVKRAYQGVLATLVLLALSLMAVVNFFNLWVIVGFFSLILLVYIFSRDTLFAQSGEEKKPLSPALLLSTAVVCVVSIFFVVAGGYAGSKLSTLTGVNYLEVRPSFSATVDVLKSVYSEDVLLGTGPNKFVDAWRLHKDAGINQSIFWNTNFTAGFGYIPTLFITTGILGFLTVIIFHGLFLQFGYRMLVRGNSTDTVWFYIGLTSFTAAAFLWLVSYVYVTGPALLLLAALFTGLSFAASAVLVPDSVKTIPLVSSRPRGFVLMTIVIIIIISSVASIFTLSKQYVAQADFTAARTEATTPEQLQQMLFGAFQKYPDETFLITSAQSRLIQLQSMLGIEEPTKEQQEEFVSIARQAVAEAREAIRLDDSNPVSHATLADLLIVLASAGFQDAGSEALGKLEDARWRDPQNPLYAMAEASLAIRQQDIETARQRIGEALTLKPNYSEALYLLSQLDVSEGKLDDAITRARQIISLEPDSPSRYYQLGVLLAAKKDLPAAIEAYEFAISRDNNFANARYMLAMAYLESNRVEDALTQLRIVRETNQDNGQLGNLITELETNGYTPATTTPSGVVNEAEPQQDNGAVVSPGQPDTTLVSPVNTVPEEEAAPAAGQ